MSGIIRFGTTQGLRGFFAVMYDDEGPIQSGIGSYTSSKEAAQESIKWAEAEGYFAQAEQLRKDYDL